MASSFHSHFCAHIGIIAVASDYKMEIQISHAERQNKEVHIVRLINTTFLLVRDNCCLIIIELWIILLPFCIPSKSNLNGLEMLNFT